MSEQHTSTPVTPLTVEQRETTLPQMRALRLSVRDKLYGRLPGNLASLASYLRVECLLDEGDQLQAAYEALQTALTTAEATATELRERLAGAEARATKAEGYAEHWEFVAKSTHETNLGLEHKLPLSTKAKPSVVELFRVKLSPKEAYGVRNCEGSMWHSYAGRLCRAAGYELPGTHTAELSNDNELIIKGNQPAAPTCDGKCGICSCVAERGEVQGE